jgi:uncharacterized membrane protein
MTIEAALRDGAALSIAGLMALMGALTIGCGLLMPYLSQNRWAGVRTPWTLADETNWKLTHRFAAWSMGVGGAVSVIGAALLTPPTVFVVGVGAVLVGSLLPLAYSYAIHRVARSR